MAALQVARVGDVHLHRRLLLMGFQQRRLANALAEGDVAQLFIPVVQKSEVDALLTRPHIQRKLGAFLIERPQVRPALADFKILAVAGGFQHQRGISTHRQRLALDESNIRIEIEIARHFGHAAQVHSA